MSRLAPRPVLAASWALCLALVACGQTSPPAREVAPSPLLAMDGDRLWVLLQAARMRLRQTTGAG